MILLVGNGHMSLLMSIGMFVGGVTPIGATSKDLTIDFCESVPGIINIIKSYSNTDINIYIQNVKLVFQKIIYWRDNAMNRFQYWWWLYNNLLMIIMIVLQPLPHLLAPPSYLWKDSVRRTNRGWFFNCSPIFRTRMRTKIAIYCPQGSGTLRP